MRNKLLLLLLVGFCSADELDMFDVVDSDKEESIIESGRAINTRVKLSHLMQEEQSNNAILYGNISQNSRDYVYDIRMVVDEDSYALNVKDLYYKNSWKSKIFMELGRVNVKEGVARAYNPTDYFKGASSFTLSNDPKDIKDNRLGSLLIQGTAILDDFTLKALYSPKVTGGSSYWHEKEHIGLHLHDSNSKNRVTLYAGYTGYDNLALSALLHNDGTKNHLGLNTSYIDARSLWYVEASISKRKSSISHALKETKNNESLFSSTQKYRPEISVGLNYTAKNSIVSTIEYIYNDAGLTSSNWNDYFKLEKENPNNAKALGEAKGFILSNGELLSQHTLFLMARQSDVVPNLDWSVMSWISPEDRSSLLQAGVSYDYDNVLISTDLRAYVGKKESQYGSMPNDYEALLSVEYFF